MTFRTIQAWWRHSDRLKHELAQPSRSNSDLEINAYAGLGNHWVWHVAKNVLVIDPCDGATTCGSCAVCRVVNHGVQCSCPAGTAGNPQITCVKRPGRCDGTCLCDESSGFCISACENNRDCACGEVCTTGVCSMKCNSNIACPQVSRLVTVYYEKFRPLFMKIQCFMNLLSFVKRKKLV